MFKYTSSQVEMVARSFHESGEMFAPAIVGDVAKRVEWGEIPETQRQLVRTIVTDLLNRGIIGTPISGGPVGT